MNADDYRYAIARLGLNQQEAGRLLGVTRRTAQNYAMRGCPEPIGRLLRFFLKHELDLRELPHV
jgi:hypothetical protein